MFFGYPLFLFDIENKFKHELRESGDWACDRNGDNPGNNDISEQWPVDWFLRPRIRQIKRH